MDFTKEIPKTCPSCGSAHFNVHGLQLVQAPLGTVHPDQVRAGIRLASCETIHPVQVVCTQCGAVVKDFSLHTARYFLNNTNEKLRILINIEDGLVQNAAAGFPLEITKLDYDTDGYIEDTIVLEGRHCFRETFAALKIKPDALKKMFSRIDNAEIIENLEEV